MLLRSAGILCVIITASSLLSCNDAIKDKSLKNIKARGYFIVGLDDNFPPMAFRNPEDNELTGFEVDLAREAAGKMGLKIQFKVMPCESLQKALENGDIDIILNALSIDSTTKTGLLYTEPYVNNRLILLTKNESTIQKYSDIKGKKIGLQKESGAESALHSNKSTFRDAREIKTYNNYISALRELDRGLIDAVLLDEIIGLWHMTSKPGVYYKVDVDLGIESYGAGLRKTDITFKNELDRVLDKIKDEMPGDRISKKWFGTNILLR